MHECKHCHRLFSSVFALGGHSGHHAQDGSTIEHVKHGRSWNRGKKTGPLSEETKQKIRDAVTGFKHTPETLAKLSASMKKAHAEGRAWNIGRSRWNSERSYPEKFFEKVILNEFDDKQYVTEYPVSIYSLDFAWPHKKKCIEIDGKQHDYPEYKARDARKDAVLKEQGWEVMRIRWASFFPDSKSVISQAKQFIGFIA